MRRESRMRPKTATRRRRTALVFPQLNFNEYNESALWGSAMNDAVWSEREQRRALSAQPTYLFIYVSGHRSVVLPRVLEEKTYRKQHVPAGLKPQTEADVITRDASLTCRPQRYSWAVILMSFDVICRSLCRKCAAINTEYRCVWK